MYTNETIKEKVILAGIHTGSGDALTDTTDESIAELEALAQTAGVEVCGVIIHNRPVPESGTYLGEGKIEELKNAALSTGADAVIFDDELTPMQIRNISDALNIKVIDRSALILDIFAMRAATKEGKIQVEIAQLKYMLPRLSGMGKALSRLGGGIGTRGPGETKLETDRRHIHRRIEALSEELKGIQRHRELLRARRKKDKKITAALVGYTNAGKSTILNLLTDASVQAEDKLFATLDPTQRSLSLSDGREIMLIDTVGFIRKLPHHLIKAFKSTLEEAAFADILIHVIDCSNAEYETHITVVNSILKEIGAGQKPTISVFNKIDMCTSHIPYAKPFSDNTVYISAKNEVGISELIKAIEDTAPGKKQRARLIIPYSEGKLVAYLHEYQTVISENYGADGIETEVLVDSVCYNKMRKYIIR